MISQPFALQTPSIALPLNATPTMPNWIMVDPSNEVVSGGLSWARWTLGATSINPITFQPLSGELWTIYGWSVVWQGSVRTNPNNRSPAQMQIYAPKFGAIYAGLLKGNYSPNPSPFAAGGGVILFPPPDISLTTKIWDPTSDPMFRVDAPTGGNATPGQPFEIEYQLPTPVTADQNSQFSFGMWMMPSLSSCCELVVGQVTMNILYESQPVQHSYYRPSG